MRIRSRMVVAIIILTLSIGLVGPLGIAQGQPTPLYPVVVTLDTGEKVFIATHTSSPADGNWISLSGGTSVTLPSVTLIYDGLSYASYTREGVTVDIDSSFDQGQATYPIATHQVYSPGQPISAKFWGAPALQGDLVDFKLLKLTSLTEARDIFTEAFQGNLDPIQSKLDGAIWSSPRSILLDVNGDATAYVSGQAVGDYLLVVIREETAPYKLYIYSATAIEVIDYTLQVSAPSSVKKGNKVNINLELISAPPSIYIYGTVMIKKTAYSGDIELSTDGTIINTEIRLNDKLIGNGALVSEFILGTMGPSDLFEYALEIMTAFESNEITFGYGFTLASTTGSMSLSTSSLATGDYILLVGVFKDLGTRMVGLKQTTVRVTLPSKPVYPPVNKPPVADAGPNQKISIESSIHFSGAGSYDPDGTIESYDWDFGDGNTASGPEVDHTYMEPGLYSVTLTVKDERGAEDSDKCEVMVWEPPAPVANKFGQHVPGEQKGFRVDASEEANTTITLDTTDNVTVTVLRYEGNPHPGDPIPAMALPIYVDVEVSNPDAVVWPIYVEVSYTDEQIGELDENTFGIYYWMDGTWQRCSNTGVDTENNIVWAYMTAEEASGSPILIGGMHAITPPPLPPILDNLIITPAELELGDNVTISFDIENYDSQSQTYGVDMHIENVNDPPPTLPPYDVTLTIWVDLGAYESKTVSHTITMDAVGDFNVTVHYWLTGSFKVGTWPPEPPLKPAEFEVSNLLISPEEVEEGEAVTVSVDVINVGEETGSYTVELVLDGVVVASEEITSLGGGMTAMAVFELLYDVGTHEVEVDGLTGSFTMKAAPEPEFEVSDLTITPEEIELGDEVTVSFTITNIDSQSCTFVPFVQIGDMMLMEGVELEGHESRTMSHTITPESAGDYDVTIDGLEGSFTVSKKPVRPFWTRPGYAAGILIVIVSVGTIIYLNWKGKLRPILSPDST